MSATSRVRFVIGIACASATLAGCASTPRNPYPMLPAPGKLEQNPDCAGLTDQIEKADARIEKLLAMKRDRSCPASATGAPA